MHTRRQLLTTAVGGIGAALLPDLLAQNGNGWAIDWHWSKLPSIPDLRGAMMSTWQMDIMDKRRLVVLTAPSMMAALQNAVPGLLPKETAGAMGVFQDRFGKAQVFLQATDSNTDPVLTHAQALSRLTPVYKLHKLVAMKAGSQASLLAAARSVPKVDPRAPCPGCATRDTRLREGARIIKAQGYNGCDFTNPVPTCTTGEYSSPYQNMAWWSGVAGYTPYYYALPTFPGYAGADWNYPLDQAFYTPNLNQTFEWHWPNGLAWQPDAVQKTKADQINFVANSMTFMGALWGLGALIAAGACPPCAACGAILGITGIIIRLLNY